MAVQCKPQMNMQASPMHQSAGSFIMNFSEFLPKLVDQMAAATLQAEFKEQKITYGIIREEDAEEVLVLLRKTFFKDEPLNCCVQLGECKDLEDYCTDCITDGCSFKAVNNERSIVGVFLSGIITKPPSDAEPCSFASKTSHEQFKKIMSFMDFVDSKFDIFSLYPDIDSFVDGKILSVDPRYRGHGIAGVLTDKTIEYMKQHQIEIFHIQCSSHFSARVCEKLGFNEVFQLPFSDYVDDDGKQILCPEKPHVAARIFTKRVSE